MQRDDVYLFDILDSATAAVEYVAGKSQTDFLADRQCQDAVIRRLEIIGEAARRLSDETRDAHPQLPWSGMIGQRNILSHKYDDVDFLIVWETVQSDLPTFISYLEPLLPAWDKLTGDELPGD